MSNKIFKKYKDEFLNELIKNEKVLSRGSKAVLIYEYFEDGLDFEHFIEEIPDHYIVQILDKFDIGDGSLGYLCKTFNEGNIIVLPDKLIKFKNKESFGKLKKRFYLDIKNLIK